MTIMCSEFAFHNALSGPFVCETGRRKESNDLERRQRRLLRAWESVPAGRRGGQVRVHNRLYKKPLFPNLNQTKSLLKLLFPREMLLVK